jgi:phosphoribosylformylglycinamidine synthase
MCLAGRAGAEVDLSAVPGADAIGSDDVVLFSESLCRFIVEVRPDDAEAFELLCEGVPHARIGHVGSQEQPQHTPALHIRGVGGNTVVQVPVAQLERAWRGEELAALDDDTVGTATGYVAIPYSPYRVTSVPRVLILHANGTNRDREAAQACRLLGAQPEIVHVNQLLSGERHVLDYQMLIIPGGFSYGDDLGAGTLWALDLRHHLDGSISTFVASGRPVLGICNGFQALVKAGLLPGGNQAIDRRSEQSVTLAPNESGHFECRWVYLRPNPASPCLFTYGIDDLVYCPVAHGEGRLVTRDDAALAAVQAGNLVALTYGDASGNAAEYPLNPNGSVAGIAGLCNPAGNVLGLMPHPEDHILPWQHPRWHRGESGMSGLRLFENGIKSC